MPNPNTSSALGIFAFFPPLLHTPPLPTPQLALNRSGGASFWLLTPFRPLILSVFLRIQLRCWWLGTLAKLFILVSLLLG